MPLETRIRKALFPKSYEEGEVACGLEDSVRPPFNRRASDVEPSSGRSTGRMEEQEDDSEDGRRGSTWASWPTSQGGVHW